MGHGVFDDGCVQFWARMFVFSEMLTHFLFPHLNPDLP